MEFEPQLPYTPDLTGLPEHTTPDWDALKTQPAQPLADYRLLRRMQYLTPGQLAQLQGRGFTDTITVLIVTSPQNTEAQIAATRASLAYQGYERLCVEVVPDNTIASVLNRLDTTWALWMMAGDTLAPYTALLALDASESMPEQVAFYFDEEADHPEGPAEPFFKPDLSLEWLRSAPYVGRSLLVRTRAFQDLALEKFSQHPSLAAYETILRLVERHGRYSIGHIAEMVYRAAVSYSKWISQPAHVKMVMDLVIAHLRREGISSDVQLGVAPGTARARYWHQEKPKVSVIIPVRDQHMGLSRLVGSLLTITGYRDYEIIIVDAGSTDSDQLAYLDVVSRHPSKKIIVVPYHEPFNYTNVLKVGIAASQGAYFCVLHPDMQVKQRDWLQLMLEYALCKDVAQVGCKLTLPDGTIQHAGVILGLAGVAGHLHYQASNNVPGYYGRLKTPQDLSAVTCVGTLIRREYYDEIGGFNSADYPSAFHDVDFSLRLASCGYRTVWTPFVTHVTDDNAMAMMDPYHATTQAVRLKRSMDHLLERSIYKLANDPYFHRHLSLTDYHPSFAYRASLGWSPTIKPVLPRIIAFPSDKSGCGLYRIHSPLNALKKAGMVEGFSSEWMIPVVELARLQPDTLIFQRKLTDTQLTRMDQYRSFLKNTFMVYELDDLLHDIPAKSIHHGKFPADTFERLARGIQMCDRLVCSTQPLADAFSDYHHDIVVRKNRLPVHIWKDLKATRHMGDVPRIGWGGGTSHRGDLEMIAEVVKHFRDRVHWVFFGMLPELLRPNVKEFYSSVNIQAYPKMLASLRLDLAVAPVEDNRFNACKSNLRVLEFGTCGYPVVASDVAAYNMDDLPITRVSSNPDDWIAAIEEQLADRDRLYQQGQALREAIHRDWYLEGKNVDGWLSAWTP